MRKHLRSCLAKPCSVPVNSVYNMTTDPYWGSKNGGPTAKPAARLLSFVGDPAVSPPVAFRTCRPVSLCPQAFTSAPKWTVLAPARTQGIWVCELGICNANSAPVLPLSGANAGELASRRARDRSRHQRWAECSRKSSSPTPGVPHEAHTHVRSYFKGRTLQKPGMSS